MGKEKTTTSTEAVKTTAVESKYSISDFLGQPKLFGTNIVIIKTALEMSGKTEFTLSEAQRIVNTFKNKEVK